MNHAEWARAQIVQQGNKEPKQESIDAIVDMLENDVDDPQDQESRIWVRQMYERHLRGISRPIPEGEPND